MMGACVVCDDLVDIDFYDPVRHGPDVLCGVSKCLKPAAERYMCNGCDKRVAELVVADWSKCIGRPPPGFIHHGKCCQGCADRHKKLMGDQV